MRRAECLAVSNAERESRFFFMFAGSKTMPSIRAGDEHVIEQRALYGR